MIIPERMRESDLLRLTSHKHKPLFSKFVFISSDNVTVKYLFSVLLLVNKLIR